MTTKILVTLGPSSMSEKVIKDCEELGVDIFRINLSHTALENVGPAIDSIRQWTEVPICLDSEGAQLRNQVMVDECVSFTDGDIIEIHFEPIVGDARNMSFSPPGIARQFVAGDEISVDFNHLRLRVEEVLEDRCRALVVQRGTVGSNKASDVERELELEPLTEKDNKAIKIGLEKGIRIFALSFTNCLEDVEKMHDVCGADSSIICKIESRSGVENLESILSAADHILIDRGDLSRKIPTEKIPFLQRRIVSIARSHSTPVYVATNLLESMVMHRTPTRAEINDVVSTLLMGGDGLVLAAETAIGEFPVDAVRMIRNLIDETEKWTPNASIHELI